MRVCVMCTAKLCFVFFGQDTFQSDFKIFRIKMYHDDTHTREQKNVY